MEYCKGIADMKGSDMSFRIDARRGPGDQWDSDYVSDTPLTTRAEAEEWLRLLVSARDDGTPMPDGSEWDSEWEFQITGEVD